MTPFTHDILCSQVRTSLCWNDDVEGLKNEFGFEHVYVCGTPVGNAQRTSGSTLPLKIKIDKLIVLFISSHIFIVLFLCFLAGDFLLST